MDQIYYGYRTRVHDPRFSVRVVTPPAEEPVTLTEACAQVRQELGVDNTYITGLIPAARQYVENVTGEMLVTRTLEIAYDAFPFPRGEIVLPFGPLQSITSITYKDLSNTQQTVDSSLYLVDTASVLGAAYLPLFNYWPLQICQSHSVKVQGVFGFGSVASGNIPALLVHAVKMMIAHFYENREPVSMGLKPEEMPLSVKAILDQYRTNWV